MEFGKKIVFLGFILFMALVKKSKAPETLAHLKQIFERLNEDKTISFIFAGDVMAHKRQIFSTYDPLTKTFNYESWFYYLKDIVSSVDIAVANLETTLAGYPYSGYPRFCAPDTLLHELKKTGFDLLTTANNHACDKGKKGILRTLDQLDKHNFWHLGTWKDTSEWEKTYPLIIQHNGFKIAFLNYTYGTNGLEIPPPTVVSMLDTNQVKKDLEKAIAASPDLIIVLMHAGIEKSQQLNWYQTSMASICQRYGVDLLIGAHPHVAQKIDSVTTFRNQQQRTLLRVFSLGNLISAQRSKFSSGGIMVEVEFKKRYNGVYLSKARYIPVWVYIEKLSEEKRKWWAIPADTIDKHLASGKMKLPPFELRQYNSTMAYIRRVLKNSPVKEQYTYYNQEMLSKKGTDF